VAADDELAGLRAQIALLVEENAALRARVAEQDVVIEELKRKVNRDSRNSSQSPSQDSPKSRAERRREARAKLKELSKRKPGG
jgi:regulator of replication initiation timing